jgi:hypothetical protein
MEHKRGETIWMELKHHLPFTLTVSLFAGVLVALVFIFNLGSSIPLEKMFDVIHPAHVLVSAAASAAIFRKYKKSVISAGIIGVIGAILIGTISDVLLPWIAGNLFSFQTVLHLPIIKEPLLILGVAIIGSLVGIYIGLFKLNHSLHVFFSVFASLFYILAFSSEIGVIGILVSSLVVFLVVYIPCCISDIVFPILFIKKPCRDCGHWHD